MNDNKYSYEEKIGAVMQGNMDPKEVGVADIKDIPIIGQQPAEQQPDPSKLRVLRGPGAKPQFGDKLEFQAGVVPLVLRAEWAAEEAKIVPFDKQDWMEKHKHEYQVQAMVACGNGLTRLDQTYSDPVLGLCAIMRAAADKIEEKYKELQKENESISDTTKK